MSFANERKRRKNIKHLIESLNFMIKNNIIHCDIKHKNIVCNEQGDLKIIDFGGAFSLNNEDYFNFTNTCRVLESESNDNINYRTQYNSDFSNNILNLISIHTEYYTPPEILTLKFILINKSKEDILEHILKTYNINNKDIAEGLYQIITKIFKNKKKMFYMLQCRKNYINSFIYKFDIFSMGIMLRETFKMLNKYFNIVIEDSLINLIEKMTDLNFKTRLNINQILKHEYFSVN